MDEAYEVKGIHYAIIGGAGFLGQHLLHLLLNETGDYQAATIKVIDTVPTLDHISQLYPENFKHNKVTLFLNTDISSDLEFNLEGVETVFHLAALIAYGRKNKKFLHNTNVKGLENVIKKSKACHVKKIIYVSSFAILDCLDIQDKTQLASEYHQKIWEQGTDFFYGYSKHQATELALFSEDDQLKIAVAIPGILLGPGPCHHASNLPFETALNKKWTLVPKGGSNYIDVRDVALGLIKLVQKEIRGKYLLGSHNLEHKDLLHKIAAIANRKLWITEIPYLFKNIILFLLSIMEWFSPRNSPYSKEGGVQAFKYRYYSNQKSMQELGWTPQYSIDETLKDAVAWYQRENFKKFDRNKDKSE